MTIDENNTIAELESQGFGYRRIVKQLNISPNTVKNYLIRTKELETRKFCPVCGESLIYTKNKIKKRFCSEKMQNGMVEAAS